LQSKPTVQQSKGLFESPTLMCEFCACFVVQ